MAEDKDNFGLPGMEEDRPYMYDEEEESGAGKIIAWIIVLVILVGGYLSYQYIYVPQKGKKKVVTEQPLKDPIKWIYAVKSQSGGIDKIGLASIEDHLYIMTQSYGNGIRVIHSESCTNPKHIRDGR